MKKLYVLLVAVCALSLVEGVIGGAYSCEGCTTDDCLFGSCPHGEFAGVSAAGDLDADAACRGKTHNTLVSYEGGALPNMGWTSHYLEAPTRYQVAQLVDFGTFDPQDLCYTILLGPLAEFGLAAPQGVLDLVGADRLPNPMAPRSTVHELSIFTRHATHGRPDREVWTSEPYTVQYPAVPDDRVDYTQVTISAPVLDFTTSTPLPTRENQFLAIEQTPSQQYLDPAAAGAFFVDSFAWYLAGYAQNWPLLTPNTNSLSSWTRAKQNCEHQFNAVECSLDTDDYPESGSSLRRPWYDIDGQYTATTFFFAYENNDCTCTDFSADVFADIDAVLSTLSPIWNVESRLPRNCQDIVDRNPDALSGSYTIFPDPFDTVGVTVSCVFVDDSSTKRDHRPLGLTRTLSMGPIKTGVPTAIETTATLIGSASRLRVAVSGAEGTDYMETKLVADLDPEQQMNNNGGLISAGATVRNLNYIQWQALHILLKNADDYPTFSLTEQSLLNEFGWNYDKFAPTFSDASGDYWDLRGFWETAPAGSFFNPLFSELIADETANCQVSGQPGLHQAGLVHKTCNLRNPTTSDLPNFSTVTCTDTAANIFFVPDTCALFCSSTDGCWRSWWSANAAASARTDVFLYTDHSSADSSADTDYHCWNYWQCAP